MLPLSIADRVHDTWIIADTLEIRTSRFLDVEAIKTLLDEHVVIRAIALLGWFMRVNRDFHSDKIELCVGDACPVNYHVQIRYCGRGHC